MIVVAGWCATCIMRGITPPGYLIVFWAALLIAALGGVSLAALWVRRLFAG